MKVIAMELQDETAKKLEEFGEDVSWDFVMRSLLGVWDESGPMEQAYVVAKELEDDKKKR